MAMSNLEMRIYTAFDGVEMTVALANDDEYQRVKQFLKDIGARIMDISLNNVPTGSDFVYVENEQQLKALDDFHRSLRQKSNPE